MSNGASRAPHEINIDLAVLPLTFCQGIFNQIYNLFIVYALLRSFSSRFLVSRKKSLTFWREYGKMGV